MSNLSETFNTLEEAGIFEEKIPKIPNYIINNLNTKFKLRYYQEKAIKRFIYYLEHYNKRKKPAHVLYHMATGSGKTLIMATNILYLYKQGYNKFIFFVDNKNIIEKTKNNFLNKGASKYLFSESISFSGEKINIKEVDNFEGINEKDINIKFSTTQGLHTSFNEPKENSITYQDFEEKDIVLISDEAHHINALTKTSSQMTVKDEKNRNTWEGTVNSIFQKSKENILLEFTATVETENENIKEKYDDKIIYKYQLKQFRLDKFSKEVKVLEGDFNKKTRALQAVILSQYRRKVAESNNIYVKPVIMMKSKSIAKSEEFEEIFINMIENLSASDLLGIKEAANGLIINDAFSYFEKKDITLDNLVKELKEDFNKTRCVSVNSKNESEEKQILVNTLEDKKNPVRVIFAVDKLNEGWDVLNLFDIVRTYQTGASSTRGPRKTTINEAQLIGRGARYYPFKINENQNLYTRKFDADIDNDLRILEELYYHCYNEPSYISELKTALENKGVIPPKKREVKLKIKDEFKETQFWRKGLIFKNQKKKVDREEVKCLDDLNVNKTFKYKFMTGRSSEIVIFDSDENIQFEEQTEKYLLSNFRNNIIRKGLDKIEFYKFNNLKLYIPSLNSIREFINKDEFIASREIKLIGKREQIENLSDKIKLNIVIKVLKEISKEIKSNFNKYEGTKVFIGEPVKEVVKEKTRKFDLDDNTGEGTPMKEEALDLRLDLSNKNWYVYDENYGTNQEKYFVKFLNNMIDDFNTKYEEVYLIRNEKLFKIYSFNDGQAFEPDFVLYLKEKNQDKFIHYQLFVEPKGEHIKLGDQWKENFLLKIKDKFEIEILAENTDFKIIGLPFYNNEKEVSFEEELLKNI